MRDAVGTKQRIETTALKLFVERGIAETTIRDIASACDIAEGTMYRHYVSKDELARHLFVENFAAVGRALRAVQAGETTTRDKLAAMIRHFCKVFESDATMFSYLFLARHRHMQQINPRLPNAYLVFRAVIRDGMARGEVPKQDADVATSMVMGVILQVIDTRILGRRIKQNMDMLAGTIIEACFRVLRIA